VLVTRRVGHEELLRVADLRGREAMKWLRENGLDVVHLGLFVLCLILLMKGMYDARKAVEAATDVLVAVKAQTGVITHAFVFLVFFVLMRTHKK
jgi:hypothetical protein